MNPPCTQDRHRVPQGSVLGPTQYIGELSLTVLSDFFFYGECEDCIICLHFQYTNKYVTWVMYGLQFYAGDCKL